ncbi:hypothetical protein KUTeg_023794 [Tegillarca granosa]|uniref:Uncharacterized protein n=1 Tax=Tegillarca granosa TaxID=220873 RepID=A0ABQ9E2P5_TEGGR|nr:hypothetical protein KUTeg_023794 [Tegillarca granosa]
MEVFFSQMRSVGLKDVDFTFYLYQVWTDPRLRWGNGTDHEYYVVSHSENTIFYRLGDRDKGWTRRFIRGCFITNSCEHDLHDGSCGAVHKYKEDNYSNQAVNILKSEKTTSVYFSDSYENNDVRLNWFYKPIEFADDFEGHSIQMVLYKTKNCTLDRSSVIINSCLEMRMLLSESQTGDISSTCDDNGGSRAPALVSALDIWFAVLLTYVTLVMVEFAVVHSIDRYQNKLKLQRQEKEKDSWYQL